MDQPEIDRQHRHEPQQLYDAAARDFPGHLGDAQWPAKLVAAARTDDDLPHRLERADRQVPGLLNRAAGRSDRVPPAIPDAAAASPGAARVMPIAPPVGDRA